MTQLRTLLLLCAAVLGGVTPLWAQQVPTRSRGVSADTAYQLGDLETVNLFTGSMNLRIPIGPSYPVGPSLSFQMTLVYDSNIWEAEERTCYPPAGGLQKYLYTEPDLTNAGLGWHLGFGHLYAPGQPLSDDDGWRYRDPSGGTHRFYDELQPGYPTSIDPSTSYTQDGTYLRMRGNSLTRYVDFPNGDTHTFEINGGVWRLTKITDAHVDDQGDHLNWIAFAWDLDPIQITDSQGRIHEITLNQDDLVTSIEPSGYAATTLSYLPGDFTLERDTRFGPGVDWETDCGSEPPTPASTLTVPVLETITLANGSTYSMDSYQEILNLASGLLEKMTLPTGGVFEWDWKAVLLPPSVDIGGIELYDERGFYTNVTGVDKRRHLREDNELSPATWSYEYTETLHSGSSNTCFNTTTVVDPEGYETEHYFSTDGDTITGWRYGLPLRLCEKDGSPASAPYPSREIYNATGDLLRRVEVEYGSSGRSAGSGSHQDKNHRLVQQRTTYFDDDTQGGIWTETTWDDFDGLGHFEVVTQKGNFTGVTQTRTSTTRYDVSGSGTAPGDYYTIVADNTSGPTNTPALFPSPIGPWILGTFTRKEVAEGGNQAISQFCFDGEGLLERQRVWKGTSVSAADLMTVFEYSDDGFPVREKHYGGDTGSLPGATCGGGLGTAAFDKVHEYSGGLLQRSAWVEPGTTPTWANSDTNIILRLADNDIAISAARISKSRDAAGVATELFYDSLGRLTREDPVPSEPGRTMYEYQDSPPKLTICHKSQVNGTSCSGAPLHLIETHSYDGLGRKTRETVRYPTHDGGSSSSATDCRDSWYDGLGRKTRDHAWNTDPGSCATQATIYTLDRFGRATQINPPAHDPTNIVYLGNRIVQREVKIEGVASLFSSYTTEEYDSFGRLVRVCEGATTNPTETCSTGIETTYGYDVLGNLDTVLVAGSQGRSFVYDGRGFLTSESHPEIVGNTTYTYDALGNPLTKTIPDSGGGAEGISLRYAYDGAGRLIKLEEQPSGSATWRPVKVFRYARTNDSPNFRRGKLVQAIRYNYFFPIASSLSLPARGGDPSSPAATITHTYDYRHGAGWLTSRLTSYVLERSHRIFRTDFTYDVSGQIETLTYPECLFAPCSGDSPDRVIEFQRSFGYLGSIDDVTSSPVALADLGYQVGGMLQRVVHGNGVNEIIEVAADRLQRPKRIRTSGVTPTFDTSTYAYDGAGNITDIGSLDYAYDSLGRLSRERLNASTRQVATYDDFGNLTNLTAAGGTPATLNVSAATNRLVNGGDVSNVAYDARGNLTTITFAGESVEYDHDAMNLQRTVSGEGDVARNFLYDADDERIASVDCPVLDGVMTCPNQVGAETLTLRGLDSKILRVFRHPWLSESWEWERDYIHRDGMPFATIFRTGDPDSPTEDRFHFHLDHLGSIRQVTDTTPQQVARHDYLAFGEEITTSGQSAFSLRYTGHERDENGGGGLLLDNMHARHCSPILARFLSVDPVDSARVSSPQTWNRYLYARNNPMRYVDPNGESAATFEQFTRPLIFVPTVVPALEAITVGTTAGISIGVVGGASLGYAVNQLPGVSEALTFPIVSDAISNVISTLPTDLGDITKPVMVESSDHDEQRRRQGRAGDASRDVGDPNRVQAEGKPYRDAKTGNTVYVQGNRIVVVSPDGQRRITRLKLTKKNIRNRIDTGRYEPIIESPTEEIRE